MVAKDFPCKICRHGAEKHYTNVSDGSGVCVSCQDRSTRQYYNPEEFHVFEGDNLAYMELQKKKQDLLNEQA